MRCKGAEVSTLGHVRLRMQPPMLFPCIVQRVGGSCQPAGALDIRKCGMMQCPWSHDVLFSGLCYTSVVFSKEGEPPGRAHALNKFMILECMCMCFCYS